MKLRGMHHTRSACRGQMAMALVSHRSHPLDACLLAANWAMSPSRIVHSTPKASY
jgi:hypothetical protein